MCETTDLIKKMAHEGSSRKRIAEALGISRRSIGDILEVMDPVTFYPTTPYTVRGFHGTIDQIIEHFGLRISARTIRYRLSNLVPGADIDNCFFEQKYGQEYEVRGFKGCTSEIIRHFGLNITIDCVYKRLRKGLPPENAHFDEVQPTHKVKQIPAQQSL